MKKLYCLFALLLVSSFLFAQIVDQCRLNINSTGCLGNCPEGQVCTYYTVSSDNENSAACKCVSISEGTNVSGNFNAGYFNHNIYYGGKFFSENEMTGNGDIIFGRLDEEGKAVWTTSFGNQWEDRVGAIHDKNEELIMTGHIRDTVTIGGDQLIAKGIDAFITKFDPDGNLLWSNLVSSTNLAPAKGTGVSFTSDNSVCAAGYYQYNAVFSDEISLSGNAFNSSYIAKYSPNGDVEWAKGLAGDHSVRITAMKLDANENIFVTGYFKKAIHFEDALGNVLLTLDAADPNAVDEEIFIAKFSPNGEFVTAKKAVGAGEDWARDLEIDRDGNLILLGDFKEDLAIASYQFTSVGDRDGFIAKYNNALELEWVKHIGQDQGRIRNNSVTSDWMGNIQVVGNFYKSLTVESVTYPNSDNSFSDIYLIEFNAEGAVNWVRTEGSSGSNDYAVAIANDKNGRSHYTGCVFGPTEISGEPVTPLGVADIYIGTFEDNMQPPTAIIEVNNKERIVKRIYPNPAKEKLFIEFNCKNSSALAIELYNVQGVLVKAEKLVCAKQSHALKLGAQRVPGIYFLEIRGEEEASEVYKIIID